MRLQSLKLIYPLIYCGILLSQINISVDFQSRMQSAKSGIIGAYLLNCGDFCAVCLNFYWVWQNCNICLERLQLEFCV